MKQRIRKARVQVKGSDAGRRLLLTSILCGLLGAVSHSAHESARVKGVLLDPSQVTDDRLRQLVGNRWNSVVLYLTDETRPERTRAAAERVQAAGLGLSYWIEIGRNPALADRHPEWMASLQGHSEWRRHFPNAPVPRDGEVVKNYPWVPIVYREAFQAHVDRVAVLLKGFPAPAAIFLNDLQSAPSACGCGNVLCRWTADYGPLRTAAHLPVDAAARFAGEVQKLAPRSKVVPVWTTECEEPDQPDACAGVGCFAGACWREFTAQLMPVADRFNFVAVLTLYRVLNRDLPRYASTAGWIKHALLSFTEMPPRREGRPVSPDRLIAVLQGWDVTEAEREAQIARSDEAGTAGYILALTQIDQGWEPRLVKLPKQPGQGR